MSMEAMKTLASAESSAAARQKAAVEAGDNQLKEAHRAALALKAENRTAAESEAKALLTAAEEKAAVTTQAILSQANAACETMQQEARGRLNEAAALIAERVVNI